MDICEHQPAALLDRQIQEARRRAFSGRERELAAFRSALTGRAEAFTVVYLHGPGGIGKSTLLSRFADEARCDDRPVLTVRAGQDARTAGGRRPPVVLIDDLELADRPEHWLRHTVLPALPAGTLVAVASRQPPSVRWRAEPGWSDLLVPLALEPFTPAESTALLRAHDVPESRVEAVRWACGGNPLALRVAAQALGADPRGVADDDLPRELALSIFHHLIGDIPSGAHRQALEACAHAATTNENLLRAVVPDGDAGVLFGWLRDQPFITSGARGLYPSEVVRNVVEAELRWRDADQFAAMHERMMGHLIKRARAVADDAALPYVADVIFVQRHERTSRSGFGALDDLEVRDHRYQPADRAEVCAIALRTQGAESARLVEFWLDRQPEGFHVQRRRGAAEIVAFTGQLSLGHPSAEELSTDPVVAAAWARAQNSTPLRTGERLKLVRFLVDPGFRFGPSDVTVLMQARVATPLIREDHLAWSVIACPESDYWPERIARTHLRDDAPPIVVDGSPYTLFSVYCGAQGIAAWSAELDDQLLARHPRAAPAGQDRFVTWNRAEFDQEVRQTLRAWRRPDRFADSALRHSRVVSETDSVDAVTGLRQAFTAALDTLGSDPRQAKYHRVLVTTFLNGAPTQEAAAERLNLPSSTYRRHLSRGLAELCTLLWKAENHGVHLLTGPPG